MPIFRFKNDIKAVDLGEVVSTKGECDANKTKIGEKTGKWATQKFTYLPEGIHVPLNDSDFDNMFTDEESCLRYMHSFGGLPVAVEAGERIRRQATGSRLKRQRKPWVDAGQTSDGRVLPTNNRFFFDRKKPLPDLFKAIWMVLKNDGRLSAKKLQNVLNIGCYQTALKWRQEIQGVMGSASQYLPFPSAAEISFDAIRLSTLDGVAGDRNLLRGKYLFVAVTNYNRRKRVHFYVSTGHPIGDFYTFTDNVAPCRGGNLISVRSEFWNQILLFMQYRHAYLLDDVGNNKCQSIISEVQNVIVELSIWLKSMPGRGVRAKQLEGYLEEFSFRKNCCYPKIYGVGTLFYHFMELALSNREYFTYLKQGAK